MHRGAIVCREESGNSKYFRCIYHGWTYASDGTLSGVPFRNGYPDDFDFGSLGLMRLPRVSIYRGFVFASLSSEGETLEDYLGPVTQYMARYHKEREVGQILWDALIGGPDSDIYRAAQQGYWDPIKPNLLLPEVLDNGKWRGGLDGAFSDTGKTFAFNFVRRITEGFFVNRDSIAGAELRDVDGLWNAKWQGKIAWHGRCRRRSRTTGLCVYFLARPASARETARQSPCLC